MAFRMYRPRKGARAGWAVRLSIAIVVFSFLLYTLDQQIRPVLITFAQYQSRAISVLAMNEAIMEELEKDGVDYNDLIRLDRMEDGSVASIEANSLSVNRLKADLTDAVSRRLTSLGETEVGVPLGTLLGLQILSGKGPVIHFRIQPASYVESEIVNRLESAGINQTQHRIFIRMKVNMAAVLPGFSTSVTVENEVCIAETLIIGSVPNAYADLGRAGAAGSLQESGQ